MKSYGPRGISWRKLPTFEHGIVISKAISFVRQWSKIFLGRLYEYVNVAFFCNCRLLGARAFSAVSGQQARLPLASSDIEQMRFHTHGTICK